MAALFVRQPISPVAVISSEAKKTKKKLGIGAGRKKSSPTDRTSDNNQAVKGFNTQHMFAELLVNGVLGLDADI